MWDTTAINIGSLTSEIRRDQVFPTYYGRLQNFIELFLFKPLFSKTFYKYKISLFYAGVSEWSNEADSKSVGLVPTKVRILSPACKVYKVKITKILTCKLTR